MVYIAHISPRHNQEASRARSGLAFASGETTVVCSSDFDESGNARDEGMRRRYPTRDTALTEATDFLVLLPPTEEWAEAFPIGVDLGTYWEQRKGEKNKPRVMCLHHPDVRPTCVLSGYPGDRLELISGTQSDVQELLIKRVYPQIQIDYRLLHLMTSELLAAVHAQVPMERHTTAATVTVTITDDKLRMLSQGKLPSDATIGGHRWERLFGQDEGQSGLTWEQIQGALQNAAMWEPILAEELEQVRVKKWQQNAVPILLKEDSNEKPAAAIVQKYEVYPGAEIQKVPQRDQGQDETSRTKVHRFSLVAFRTPLLFSPSDARPVASAYHLVSVSQLFRFSVIERDLKVLKDLREQLAFKERVKDFEEKLAAAISDIRRHLMLVDVESARREFLQRMASFREIVLEAYGSEAREREEIKQRQARLTAIMPGEWIPIYDSLKAHLLQGEAKLGEAIECLQQMERKNAELLCIASDCYARLAHRAYAPQGTAVT